MDTTKLRCKDCDDSAMTFCFAHIPKGFGVAKDESVTFDVLRELLRKVSDHEALKITKANLAWKSDLVGCGVCLKEWASHDPDCLVMKISDALEKSKPQESIESPSESPLNGFLPASDAASLTGASLAAPKV